MIDKYYLPEPNVDKYIVGRMFTYRNKNHKIYLVEKTWGKPPCLLAYAMAINDDGSRERFLIRCKMNIYTKNESDKWLISIDKDE